MHLIHISVSAHIYVYPMISSAGLRGEGGEGVQWGGADRQSREGPSSGQEEGRLARLGTRSWADDDDRKDDDNDDVRNDDNDHDDEEDEPSRQRFEGRKAMGVPQAAPADSTKADAVTCRQKGEHACWHGSRPQSWL